VGLSRGIRPLCAIFAIAMGTTACRASMKAKANVNNAEAQAEVDDDRKWEVAEASGPAEESPAAAPKPAPRVAAAVAPVPHSSMQFYGVTHDLTLAPNAPRAATCRCLAVAYGPPGDPKFAWQSGAPLGDHDALAIAITGDGVGCNEGSAPSRTSIAGVERDGTDIVLIVETVREGRPVMRGAVAPYPGPNGAIAVRTRQGMAYPGAAGGGCRIALR
jgi:hypothetical protein